VIVALKKMQFLNNPPDLEDIHPCLRLRMSKKAKRIALRLDNKSNHIHLVVPHRTSLFKAYNFAKKHENWINEKYNELPTPIPFIDGNELPIMGQPITLDIFSCNTLKRTDIVLKNNILSVKSNKENPSPRITRFLRQKAKTHLSELAHKKADIIQKEIKDIKIKDTKSRWGSCSPDNVLSFSWRIIFAPYEAFDYLVAHEVAHLTHKNHSRSFWSLCEELSEDYLKGKKWIRNEGHTLMRYGQYPLLPCDKVDSSL
jgi:predicted metal-dependent hydrolase